MKDRPDDDKLSAIPQAKILPDAAIEFPSMGK